ncbi:MAG: YdaU family protein [Magnetococcales bacterium]|nr:YdaU family protein [Magnetococcales bacterium]
MNYYPFHVGDYLSHTAHLTEHEDLTYRRMLDLYYQTEKPFTDAKKVARKVRSDQETVEIILDEFFQKDDDGWHNERADVEIEAYYAKKDAQSRAGKASVQAREKKSAPNGVPTEDERRSNGVPTEDERRSNGVPTEGDASFNQPEPDLKSSPPNAREEPNFSLPPEIPPDAWDSWEAHLQSRQPNWRPTNHAKVLSLNRLLTICAKGHEPRAVIEMAIRRGWSDFNEPTPDFDKGKPTNGKPTAGKQRQQSGRRMSASQRVREAMWRKYDGDEPGERLCETDQDSTIDGEVVPDE